jgi:uncharacterized membrane protein (UPF0127 family)
VSSCESRDPGGANAGDGSGKAASSENASAVERVVIGEREFNLELALDDASRARGLMHRDHIDEHGGMLFVFPNSKVGPQSFWMKNCLVDMDIIYLDGSGRITAMHRMKALPPRRGDETEAAYEARVQRHAYPSGYPAQFAIELRSGWLDQLNLKVEDRIELDLPRLKAMAK